MGGLPYAACFSSAIFMANSMGVMLPSDECGIKSGQVHSDVEKGKMGMRFSVMRERKAQ